MSRNCLLILFVLLTASTASAENEAEYEAEYEADDQVEGPPSLKGSGRFSLQTGWRYAPNTRFFDHFYAEPENQGVARAGGGIGGPLLTATFAYSPLKWLEVGFDVFFTYERMRLTERPGLNAITFGMLLGLRLQKRLELGPEGFIPFVGALFGPTFAGAAFDGGRSVENFAQTLGVAAGGTLRLSPKWGVSFEYRLTHITGQAESLGPYDAGGNWFAVGITYIFPPAPDRPLSRNF